MNKRKNKGITLVALVITIIVLLILAGVSLSMVFNQNGLIAKAQQAANETEKAKNNETSDIDKLTGQIDSYQVPVPEGFYHVEGSTIENGFVISSVKDDDLANTKQGNQFVWVPVASKEDWKQDFSYTSNYGATASNTTDGNLPEGITAESIAKVGGFYIARYEAGKPAGAINGETAPISKKGVTVWTYITQVDCLKSSLEMYNNSKVVSGLITGAGWDVTMKFITNYGEKKNVLDSSTWGNYTNNANKTGNVATAGKEDTWQANHIYDLGGNAWEYINEKNASSNPFVYRGGSCLNSGLDNPASIRIIYNGIADGYLSFRVALYIK